MTLSKWKMFSEQDPSEAQIFSIVNNGADLSLSDNFDLREFACNDGSDKVIVHPSLVALLQAIRNHYGKPVRINSAYRTEEYNASVGGAPNSKHKLGMAADIVVDGVEPEDIAELAEEYFVGGIGMYNTFTHLDVYGSLRRWDYRT